MTDSWRVQRWRIAIKIGVIPLDKTLKIAQIGDVLEAAHAKRASSIGIFRPANIKIKADGESDGFNETRASVDVYNARVGFLRGL